MTALERAIDRPLPTFLIAILVVIFGLWALSELPVKRAPEIQAPYSVVVVPYIGATAEEVESEVTLELEEELGKLDDLREMAAASSEGVGLVFLQFEDRTDMDDALRDVREAVSRAEARFHDDVDAATVMEISTDDMPIIFFTLSGDVGLQRLRQLAEDLKPQLDSVQGVSEVEIYGGFEPEVRIFADPAVLAAYDLTF